MFVSECGFVHESVMPMEAEVGVRFPKTVFTGGCMMPFC